MAFSRQPDKAISQVLAPDQKENHKNDDDARQAQDLDQRAEGLTQELQGARRLRQ